MFRLNPGSDYLSGSGENMNEVVRDLKIPFLSFHLNLITNDSISRCPNAKTGSIWRPKPSLVKTLRINYKINGTAEIVTFTRFLISSQPCLTVNACGIEIAMEDEQAFGHKLTFQLPYCSTKLWGLSFPQSAG